MNVQMTSLEAYADIKENLGERQMQVLNALEKFPNGLSNLQISRVLGLAINSVTPRVKELRDKGLVVFSHYVKDRVTGKRCMVWKKINY